MLAGVLLDRQLELLGAAVTRRYEDADDVQAAQHPDDQGIGVGPDVVVRPAGVAGTGSG